MYKYRGFGLNIASDIEFPELLPVDFAGGNEDVTISYGSVPEQLEGEVMVKKIFSSLGRDEYILTIRNVCRYYAGFGKKILVEPMPGADLQSVRLFLLGTVMSALLYQRETIPLHASAIICNGGLILFAGNSGSGKSTLAAHLGTKGYEVFTDDICVLSIGSDNRVYGTASYPMIKLWEDAVVKLDEGKFSRDQKIRPKLPKYGHFFHEKFNAGTLPVHKIFVLHPGKTTDHIVIEKAMAVQAFKELEKQAYRHQLIINTKLRGLFFSLTSRMSDQVPVFTVSRPLTGAGVDVLSAEIEKLF